MHRVRGKEEARQEAPGPAAQQRAGEGRDKGGDQAVEKDVEQVVAPGEQAMQGVVEAEGQCAEGTEGLVAATVGEQGSPEVVIEDVGPRGLREEVLVGLDGSTENKKKVCKISSFHHRI